MTRRWWGLGLSGAALSVAIAVVFTSRGVSTAYHFEPVMTISSPLGQPMDVAFLQDGRLAVADAGLDEVILFDEAGGVVWRSTGPEGAPFKAPGGLWIEGDQVWVADTGNARVVHLDADGGVAGSVDLVIDEQPVFPTDLMVLGDQLWIADSTGDRVVIVEATSGEVLREIEQPVGGDYPLKAPRSFARLAGGEIAVCEALGAQVTVIDTEGNLVRTVGEWGAGEGRFIKPKSIAVAPNDGLLVLDSYQGLLQWMNADGEFVQVASSAQGVLTWEHPLTVDLRGERMAVCDPGSHQVHVYAMHEAEGEPPGIPRDQDLLRGLLSFDGDMSRVCYQCHDGTVGPAADRWDLGAHNHPLEVDHPQMVATGIELDSEGNLGCTSCHTFHLDESFVEPGIWDVLGEQAREEEIHLGGTEFCYLCHQDHRDYWVERDLRRNHPVGVSLLSEADPTALIEAGGQLSSDETVACDTCHRIHGSKMERLLVLDPASAELCNQCHEDIIDGGGQHPLEMTLDASTRALIEEYGGVFGAGGEVACMSCHDPHMAQASRLLRVPNEGGALCVSCHREKEGVQRGAHATVATSEVAKTNGPCGACHSVHRPIAAPVGGVAGADQLSRHCLGCHDRASRGNATKVTTTGPHTFKDTGGRDTGSLPLANGRMGCSTCHDGHSGATQLLRIQEEGGALCLTCHSGRRTVMGTDHDATIVVPDGPGGKQTCTSCHSNHDPRGDFLFARKAVPGVNPADGRCLTCHGVGTEGAETKLEYFEHNRNLTLTAAGVSADLGGEIPIFDSRGRRTDSQAAGHITCMSCHDPHKWDPSSDEVPGEASDGRASNSFLREPKQVRQFCSTCHGKEALPRFNFFHRDTYRKEEG